MTQDELHLGVGNIEAARRTCSVLVEHALVSGDDEVLAERRSLMRIGEVRNVSALTPYAVALGLDGQPNGTAESKPGRANPTTTSAATVSAIATNELVAHAD